MDCSAGVLAASSFASIAGGSGGPYPARARAAVTAPGPDCMVRVGACVRTGSEKRRNVVYWNPNGRSSMISCAIKSFKRHSQGMSLFMVCVFVF